MSTQQQIIELKNFLDNHILGQGELISRLLIAILADGHLLVEGAPGLAKTTAVKILASGIEGDFHRVQFTPDLLPADLTGTDIYRPETASFHFQHGPLFHNIVLADEINRAPAKVQAALLEAMGERQITVGKQTYKLPPLFMVMATQNPIEQEGTYPLPEAQLDRFLMHVKVQFPRKDTEREILHLVRSQVLGTKGSDEKPEFAQIAEGVIFAARKEILEIHMSEDLEEYLVQIILATREAGEYGADLQRWIRFGASPRATIALDRCARAHAWLSGRDFVTPDDIQTIAHDVLRHRILLTFEAEAEGVNPDRVIDELLQRIAVP
ncbi:MAG: MoxR family ATPase [Gammaproteobacteria bacterium]|mgnify:CR=1 FL=1|nr:MAG: MoxR family ATPase [Gammaproteobacteria bacterium]